LNGQYACKHVPCLPVPSAPPCRQVGYDQTCSEAAQMRFIYDSIELGAAVLFRTPLKDPKGPSIMYLSRTILYSWFGSHMTHEDALRGEKILVKINKNSPCNFPGTDNTRSPPNFCCWECPSISCIFWVWKLECEKECC